MNLWKLTGGRPMDLLFPDYFTDKVNHKPVNLYRDRLGRFWMAMSRWSLFRVQTSLITLEYIEWLKNR